MLHTTRSAAIGLVAVLGLGTMALAQPPESGKAGLDALSPAIEFKPILRVSGAASGTRIVDPGELTHKANLRRVRGQITELTVDWSAAGLPGTIQSLWNSDEYEIPDQFGRAKIHAGSFLMRDEVGSWAGPFGGVEYTDGATDLQATLMGAGGYAGQCGILNVIWSHEVGWEMDGLVFDCHSLETME